ncbi:DML1 [Candida oxycetoniae]|uniref:Protein DML1 n=1 Tax=Candida oxycetoniae TaxID=497107 RepID=A0AAI9WW63_9ASCO|nr:DML1 [Candida oxycetoniae]KAI3402841.2 DML1 [Candida oxycetoniae]
MSEILNLSFGQYANNTITHLFNCQESEVSYVKKKRSNHDLNTFLHKTNASSAAVTGSNSKYCPRALLFDLRGGLGALKKYEYSESIPNFDMPVLNSSATTCLVKNEYQKNLDKGIVSPNSPLNSGNTKYWTDFNKLVYNPKSLTTVPNYIHEHNQPGSHYNFANQKFETYNTGQNEFKNVQANAIENFRYWLEKCDFLQGIQIGTSLNDSWGGFSTSMIQSIQDEFFNNKENVWIFASFGQESKNKNKNKSRMRAVSEIKTFVELINNSTLLFPIKPNFSSLTSSSMLHNLDPDSIWHTAAIPAMFINSIWGINNQYVDQVSMTKLQDNLLRGEKTRKIVNEIKIINSNSNNNEIRDMMDVDLSNLQDWAFKLNQPKHNQNINLGISGSNKKCFSRNSIMKNPVEPTLDQNITNIYSNPWIENILQSDTFPDILTNGKRSQFHIEFNVHGGLKDFFKQYRTIIERTKSSIELTEIVDDKSELFEDLNNIISNYSSGFDSEDDDDFYD